MAAAVLAARGLPDQLEHQNAERRGHDGDQSHQQKIQHVQTLAEIQHHRAPRRVTGLGGLLRHLVKGGKVALDIRPRRAEPGERKTENRLH